MVRVRKLCGTGGVLLSGIDTLLPEWRDSSVLRGRISGMEFGASIKGTIAINADGNSKFPATKFCMEKRLKFLDSSKLK